MSEEKIIIEDIRLADLDEPEIHLVNKENYANLGIINKVEVKSGEKFIDAEFEQPMCEFCEKPLGFIRLKQTKENSQTKEPEN